MHYRGMKHVVTACLLALCACASSPAPTPTSSSTATPRPALVGAPASLNAPFRDAALNVDTWSQRFEGESREVYRARESVVAALGLQEGQVVADVGAGTGLFVAYLAGAVGPTGQVIAVEISPAFVEHIRQRADAAGLAHVTAQLGETADVKLPPSSVDLIFLCDTYHHFEDTAGILATMRQALKPGGRLAVVDYHRIEGKTRPFLMKTEKP